MTAAISGQTHKNQQAKGISASEQAKQASSAQGGRDVLMEEFSAVLDQIASQLADMDIPYGEVRVDLKFKAEPKAEKPADQKSEKPEGQKAKKEEDQVVDLKAKAPVKEEKPAQTGRARAAEKGEKSGAGQKEVKRADDSTADKAKVEEEDGQETEQSDVEAAAQVETEAAAAPVGPSETLVEIAAAAAAPVEQQLTEEAEPVVEEAVQVSEPAKVAPQNEQVTPQETAAAIEQAAAESQAAAAEPQVEKERPAEISEQVEMLETAPAAAVQVSEEAAKQSAAESTQSEADAALAAKIEAAFREKTADADADAQAQVLQSILQQNVAATPDPQMQTGQGERTAMPAAMLVLQHLAESAKFPDVQSSLAGPTTQVMDVSSAKQKSAPQQASSDTATKAAFKALPRQLAARTIEKVEVVLKEAARSRDGKTISMRLDPPDLGRVKVDVSIRNGSLHARMVAEVPQVNALLKDKAGELQMVLRKMGLNVDQVQVSVSSGQGEAGSEQPSPQGDRPRGRQVRQDSGREETQEQGFLGSAAADARPAMEDHWIA